MGSTRELCGVERRRKKAREEEKTKFLVNRYNIYVQILDNWPVFNTWTDIERKHRKYKPKYAIF